MIWLIVAVIAIAIMFWMYPKAKSVDWNKKLDPKMRDVLMGEPDDKNKDKSP